MRRRITKVITTSLMSTPLRLITSFQMAPSPLAKSVSMSLILAKSSKSTVAKLRTTILKNFVILAIYTTLGLALIVFIKRHSPGILLEEKEFNIAKNVETRLEDVKGMDEIRDEI